ncbi:hypothetical protein CDD80_1913 [Ophiocordyceps camponoti-rufipedis]|uniref:Zn(2)-C6 fungal-type domain-containing protein n=1 Tax=Ophiocordyceps camponoti-rufipedis TaxID=2004952 RepID=A0A2C5Z9W0_9HYPO|nr:hypothetical protein CDD80_1913 [Ophiocordyceps camponoti-rufipedis]
MSPTSPANSRPKRKRSSGLVAADSSPGSGLDDDDDVDHHDDDHHDRKRQPGVKRACNECRQQKLRCDVVQEPFHSCSRCNRLKLACKIESNFKRVGKRSKHAEMEKEIERLRRNVSRARAQGYVVVDDDDEVDSPVAPSTATYSHTRNPSLMGSDEAVSSLLHLKRGGPYNLTQPFSHELETVRLTDTDVSHLFNEFFAFYHPFLPFLNPQQPPEAYKQQHPLLFWAIVAVAARRFSPPDCPNLLTSLSGPMTRYLWTTIGEVPSNYHVVKAMCLLCTWPLPTSTTTSDPTHILCGVMMKTATGIGLHRPNHIRDFSRVSVELNKEQLHDRVTTWAVCNIVAQNIGTGYGQPASSLYDWTLALRPGDDPALHLSRELEARLQIERFCDKVSKEMYSNASDPRGVAGDEHRAMLMRVYRRDFAELQASILSQQLGPIASLHLRAAALHMRLAGFFDSSKTPGYMDDLMGLWRAATSFLDDILEVDKVTSPRDALGGTTGGTILLYATNYLQQMLVAAAFALLKLMRSFFCKTIDFDRGRSLFHHSIRAIRATSVVNNDLQWRLAELMVQMWNGARLDGRRNPTGDDDSPIPVDDSLQLKVRCRHSMSLVFDSVWRWREEYQAQGRGSLESESTPAAPRELLVALAAAAATAAAATTAADLLTDYHAVLQDTKLPTNPDSANEGSPSSSPLDGTLMPSHLPPTSNATATNNNSNAGGSSNNNNNGNNNGNSSNNNGNGNHLIAGNGTLTPSGVSGLAGAASGPNSMIAGSSGGGIGYGDASYDFFDPQHWMLDGLLDFNYSYVPPLEGA